MPRTYSRVWEGNEDHDHGGHDHVEGEAEGAAEEEGRVEEEVELADWNVPALLEQDGDDIRAAGTAQGAEHHAAARAMQHSADYGRVDFVFDGNFKVDEIAHRDGDEGAVNCIEQKTAPGQKPARNIDWNAERGIEHKRRHSVPDIGQQQEKAHYAAGQEIMGSGDALHADCHQRCANCKQKQIPGYGIGQLAIVFCSMSDQVPGHFQGHKQQEDGEDALELLLAGRGKA